MCKKIYFPFTLGLSSHQKSFVHERTAVRTQYRSEWFSTISEVPKETWSSISTEPNLYFDPNYLEALESTNSETIDFHYLVLYRGMTPVAQAIVQVLDFEVNLSIPDASDKEEKGGIWNNLGKKIIDAGRKRPLRMMVCGNVFVTGETSFRVLEGESQVEAMRAISDAFGELRKEVSEEKKVDAILFKDYAETTPSKGENLKNYGFHSFQVEPNMVLDMDEGWKTFQDYTASMVAKFRTKAKSAYKKSKDLVQKDLTLEEMDEHLPEMERLYRSVADKADFNMAVMNLKAYAELKRKIGEACTIRTYWLEGKMVSFMTALVNGETLDAHFVGFEYDLNRQYQLYSRILYDYVQIGVEKQVKRINFGRTSNEIKSTLGALPVPLTCYARHRNPLTNQVVSPIFRVIGPKPFEMRTPFKKEFYEAKKVH